MSKKESTDIVQASHEEFGNFLIFDEASPGTTLKTTFAETGITVFDLPKIKVPKTKFWDFDGEAHTSFKGVILYAKAHRVYYQNQPTSGEKPGPPDCSSRDMLEGVGNPGGDCIGCLFNEWGSAEGDSKGKACSERKDLYLLPEANGIPHILDLPPTSLGPLKKYVIKYLSRRQDLWGAVTEFTLDDSGTNPVVVFTKGKDLDVFAAAKFKSMREGLLEYLLDAGVHTPIMS